MTILYLSILYSRLILHVLSKFEVPVIDAIYNDHFILYLSILYSRLILHVLFKFEVPFIGSVTLLR